MALSGNDDKPISIVVVAAYRTGCLIRFKQDAGLWFSNPAIVNWASANGASANGASANGASANVASANHSNSWDWELFFIF